MRQWLQYNAPGFVACGPWRSSWPRGREGDHPRGHSTCRRGWFHLPAGVWSVCRSEVWIHDGVNSILLEPVIDTVCDVVPIMGILQVHWIKKQISTQLKSTKLKWRKCGQESEHFEYWVEFTFVLAVVRSMNDAGLGLSGGLRGRKLVAWALWRTAALARRTLMKRPIADWILSCSFKCLIKMKVRRTSCRVHSGFTS